MPVSFEVNAFVQGGFPASAANPQVIWVPRDTKHLGTPEHLAELNL